MGFPPNSGRHLRRSLLASNPAHKVTFQRGRLACPFAGPYGPPGAAQPCVVVARAPAASPSSYQAHKGTLNLIANPLFQGMPRRSSAGKNTCAWAWGWAKKLWCGKLSHRFAYTIVFSPFLLLCLAIRYAGRRLFVRPRHTSRFSITNSQANATCSKQALGN
jgi:hypothetical protein